MKKMLFTLLFTLQTLSFSLLGFLWWLQTNFSATTFEQVIFYINQGTQIVGQVDRGLVIGFASFVIIIPVFVVLIEILLLRLIFIKKLKWNTKPFVALISGISAIVITGSLVYFDNTLGVNQYFAFQKYDTIIDENYKFPSGVTAPEDKQNLVIIYVESLDNEFSNPDLFGKNLISKLDNETSNWVEFPSYTSTWWGGWTIGAFVATQCALPLKQSSETFTVDETGKTVGIDGNSFGSTYNAFMPGATCLGDVLKDSGYTNVFMGGADAYFAGKGKFLSEHGYEKVLDRNYWASVGEEYFNGWGLPDDRLLENAKSEVTALYSSSQPFNLTVLTLDTHLQGEHSMTCAPPEEKTSFFEVLSCSTDQIADFVSWMDSEGYLSNTSVVVLGDHLHMGNEEINPILAQSDFRSVFNRFYSSAGVEPNSREISQIDFFPTVLGMLGFGLADGNLGLGVSGFGYVDPSLKTISDIPDYSSRIGYKSKLIDDIWSSDRE